MQKSLTSIGIAGIMAIACTTAVMADSGSSVLLGVTSWDSCTDSAPAASFAWAGEDETYASTATLLGQPKQIVSYDEEAIDPELLTGIPAPEPPALVLAGMAFGGVLCGRSLLIRRRKVTTETDSVNNSDA
jgi:hypothetical protein